MTQSTQVQTVNMSHHTVSVISQIMESGTQNKTPEVGMHCTKNFYTDRIVCTITTIYSETRIGVKNNVVKCLDYYAGKHEILGVYDVQEEDIFTKRKNGRWVKEHESMQKGLGLSLGSDQHYIDPCF